jgi:hypothetical protein
MDLSKNSFDNIKTVTNTPLMNDLQVLQNLNNDKTKPQMHK